MAQLAIKGHPTRGNEVIKILEMIGGKNDNDLNGEYDNMIYTINSSYYNEIIYMPIRTDFYVVFTLEEFLEKFPYKVGDKVKNARINDFIGRITNARWDGNEKQIIYTVEWDDVTKSTLTYFARGLQHYKEETMEEQKAIPPYMDYDVTAAKEQKTMEKNISLIINWFDHIAQIADDRKTLTGFVMSRQDALDEIKCLAKRSKEYVEMFMVNNSQRPLPK